MLERRGAQDMKRTSTPIFAAFTYTDLTGCSQASWDKTTVQIHTLCVQVLKIVAEKATCFPAIMNGTMDMNQGFLRFSVVIHPTQTVAGDFDSAGLVLELLVLLQVKCFLAIHPCARAAPLLYINESARMQMGPIFRHIHSSNAQITILFKRNMGKICPNGNINFWIPHLCLILFRIFLIITCK